MIYNYIEYMKNKLNIYFSIALMVLSLFSLINALNIINYDYSIIIEWLIVSINSCNIYITIIFDFISIIFFSTVSFISSVVMLYRGDYIKEEKFIDRFNYIVMMFVLSIIILILRPNVISLILGWDGLGLVSYCLVIFYQNNLSNNAGILTALINRIGDVIILISIAWMLNFGSWNFISFIDKININNIIVLIIIAGFTKRAQIPFSSWLPAAIAAPTPVSALVHSSTLVTAGVYLLIRFNRLIMQFNLIKLIIVISIITIIISGIGANFEFDLKKIIALSTLRQLGIIIIILIIGFPLLSFFHLIIHALFKASLFLCAGIIIHNFNNNQDIRMIGCLNYQMPLTITIINIANISLCGIPFISGFYSKDLIIEIIYIQNYNIFILILIFIGVILTSAYSARLTFYSINIDFNFYKFRSMMEKINYMILSIIILTIYSIISGSLFRWLILIEINIIVIPIELKIITIILVTISIWVRYEISIYSTSKINIINEFFGRIWFIKQISTFHNQLLILENSKNFQKYIDLGWGELIGPMGLVNINFNLTGINLKIIENNFKIQIISFILWIILLLLI